MRLLQSLAREAPGPCPYLPGRTKRYEYFLAAGLDAGEMAAILARGWRKFGSCFFRPACNGCRCCIPLRVDVDDFVPSRSQRRLLRSNAGVRVRFGELQPTQRVFQIYHEHSFVRFGQTPDPGEMMLQFFAPSGPALQSEFRREGELVAVGFLDCGSDALSSVYFCYDPRYSSMGLGNFSILKEIEHARALGLRYYYLGYFIPGSPRMAYKDHFRPRQYYDWSSSRWCPASAGTSFVSD